MTTFTVRQILVVIFMMSVISLIIGIASDTHNFDTHASSRGKAYAAFQVIGLVSLIVVIIMEVLSALMESVRANRTAYIISIAFMIIASVSTVIACAVYSAGHTPYGWTVAACTLLMEAVLIFLLTHIFV